MTVATTNDVYGLAMEFEKIAQGFYATLAAVCDRAEVRQLFAKLSKAEALHFDFFKQLRESLASRPAGKTQQEVIEKLIKTHILPSPKAVHDVAVGGHFAQAKELAIKMEQDSIKFYNGLLPILPDHQNELASIVQEEQKHIEMISALAAPQ